MTLHLAEFAATVVPGAYAMLLLDQAERHGSDGLIAPPNITLLSLRSKCRELNPAEDISSSCETIGFRSASSRLYKNMLDHCCFAWKLLVDKARRIMFIGRRKWAHAS